MINLYPHQTKLKTEIYRAWQSGAKNVLAVMPTGSGKTVTFSDVVREHQGNACVIAHRKELVCQMSLSLARSGVRHRVIGPDHLVRLINRIHTEELGCSYYHPNAGVAVSSVQTLTSKKQYDKLIKWCHTVTLWVQDEIHHCAGDTIWTKAVKMFPNAKGLGVTATPSRMDGLGLGRHADGVMDVMVEGPTQRQLIRQGYLADYKIFAPPQSIDITQIKLGKDGDFTQPSLKREARKSRIVGDVVAHYHRFVPGKLTVVFSTDVETAHEQAKKFEESGVPAAALSADTPAEERFQTLKRFKNREIMVLVNVALFDEGFDLPAMEAMIDASPTMSFGKFIQRCGRVLRTSPGKSHGIIVDAAGNVARHARVVEEDGKLIIDLCARKWTLDRQDRRSRKTPDDAIPIKTCDNCLSDYAAVYPQCPYCHHKPIPVSRSGPECVAGDLTELDAQALNDMLVRRSHVDATVEEYLQRSGAIHLAQIPMLSAAKRHRERQAAQTELRESIGWWAAWQSSSDAESYRRFYYLFGIDVLSAQALNATEANKLKILIDEVINKEYYRN
jgi:superfamily II DNA or RNA helicase